MSHARAIPSLPTARACSPPIRVDLHLRGAARRLLVCLHALGHGQARRRLTVHHDASGSSASHTGCRHVGELVGVRCSDRMGTGRRAAASHARVTHSRTPACSPSSAAAALSDLRHVRFDRHRLERLCLANSSQFGARASRTPCAGRLARSFKSNRKWGSRAPPRQKHEIYLPHFCTPRAADWTDRPNFSKRSCDALSHRQKWSIARDTNSLCAVRISKRNFWNVPFSDAY